MPLLRANMQEWRINLAVPATVSHNCCVSQLPQGNSEWPATYSSARKPLVSEVCDSIFETPCKAMLRPSPAQNSVDYISLPICWFLGIVNWQVWLLVAKAMSHGGHYCRVQSLCNNSNHHCHYYCFQQATWYLLQAQGRCVNVITVQLISLCCQLVCSTQLPTSLLNPI